MRQDFSERVLQTKKLMKFYTPYNYPLIHLRYLNLRLFKVYEIHLVIERKIKNIMLNTIPEATEECRDRRN